MAEPLASWNDTLAKAAIVDFVERTTTRGSDDYLKPIDRIAVFDNDGTLWTEQPLYNQFLFAFDRVRALAPDHPEWNDDPVLRAVIDNDLKTVFAGGEAAIVDIVMASHAGMTSDEFNQIVCEWIATAKHPRWDRLYPETAFVPMVELLGYLRDKGYRTYIVSGGGVEFMRAFAEDAYGVPPEQIIGSTIKTEFAMVDGEPVLVRKPEVDFIDDGPGKPVGIGKFIGRRPVICVGNSDGDLEMLQYTAGGDGPRLMALVHHDDDAREVAYDKGSPIGGLDKALTEARERGWTVISMKDDFGQIFAS